MKEQTFKIKGEFIELIKLLKACGFADTGARAQAFVEEESIKVNTRTETRKRAKIRPGDVVETPYGIVRAE
jgi:ribosome-associated protein